MSKKKGIMLIFLVVSLMAIASAFAQQVNLDIYSRLPYRFIGPVGNRVTAVVGVAGDACVYYVGDASGRIFKTTDGGIHWEPIFDDQPVSSIGSLAVAPSDPNVVWAGTNDGLVWVTQNGGDTWTNLTENIRNLPPWGTVSNIEPSRYQARKAYITVDFYVVNDRDPYVYKTNDYGWTKKGMPGSWTSV